MKLFNLNTKATSYTYEIVKIAVSLAFIIVGINFKHIIPIQFESLPLWVDILLRILAAQVVILSVLCIYNTSVGELCYVYANRSKKKKGEKVYTEKLPIETVIELVSENDIVEVEACVGAGIIKIGASAESDYSSSKFGNKLFYIGDAEYETIKPFIEALNAKFPDGSLPVSRVGGLLVNARGNLLDGLRNKG